LAIKGGRLDFLDYAYRWDKFRIEHHVDYMREEADNTVLMWAKSWDLIEINNNEIKELKESDYDRFKKVISRDQERYPLPVIYSWAW
jgi:hypothetical protein